MATEQLINLDTLDLTNVALSKEELDKFIPQSGNMRQIDHIAWINEDQSMCVSVRKVRDDEFWVEGHIPGRPLFPGVLLIEAAAQAATALYRLKCKDDGFLGFARCDDVIFRGQVVPGDVIYFVTKELEFRRRRSITLNQAILNGTLIFEGRITGMRM
ncbi:MAG: hypothetical protein O7G85_05440 [Planctomycetota bacterium]|nr:hypothetical protein [Planctomycetota bacterium]